MQAPVPITHAHLRFDTDLPLIFIQKSFAIISHMKLPGEQGSFPVAWPCRQFHRSVAASRPAGPIVTVLGEGSGLGQPGVQLPMGNAVPVQVCGPDFVHRYPRDPTRDGEKIHPLWALCLCSRLGYLHVHSSLPRCDWRMQEHGAPFCLRAEAPPMTTPAITSGGGQCRPTSHGLDSRYPTGTGTGTMPPASGRPAPFPLIQDISVTEQPAAPAASRTLSGSSWLPCPLAGSRPTSSLERHGERLLENLEFSGRPVASRRGTPQTGVSARLGNVPLFPLGPWMLESEVQRPQENEAQGE